MKVLFTRLTVGESIRMKTRDQLVGIINYGASNLLSIENALSFLGVQSFRVSDKDGLIKAERLVLPGVGSFASGMKQLLYKDLVSPIRDVVQDGKPILGICLGMQLLASCGTEGGDTEGLNLIPGEVQRLDTKERIPHVGWNSVSIKKSTELLADICDDSDFYFVHSYYFNSQDTSAVCGLCSYGTVFPAIVQKGNVYGVQFHPEKSHKAGIRIIRNFLDT